MSQQLLSSDSWYNNSKCDRHLFHGTML